VGFMRAFSIAELSSMQATQVAAMMDCCDIMTHTPGAADERGLPAVTYPVSATGVPCGFEHSKTDREFMGATRAGTQVPTYDGSLRLPINTVITERDRVRITARFGVTETTPTIYEVVGLPRKGPSGLYVRLNKLTFGA
jgi:hypothetical protein